MTQVCDSGALPVTSCTVVPIAEPSPAAPAPTPQSRKRLASSESASPSRTRRSILRQYTSASAAPHSRQVTWRALRTRWKPWPDHASGAKCVVAASAA